MAHLQKDVIEEARRLWDTGLSASQIGKIMGRTKFSIIGMAHRNDFTERPSPIKPRDPNAPSKKVTPESSLAAVKKVTAPSERLSIVTAKVNYRSKKELAKERQAELELLADQACATAAPSLPEPVEPTPVKKAVTGNPMVGGAPDVPPARRCQYPLWGEKQIVGPFCDDPVIPGRPYCETHCKICYHKLVDFRDRI